MTVAVSGTPITLVATFESAGTAADPELPLTLTITPAAGGAAHVTTTTLGQPATGIFTYLWTPPTVAASTDYLAVWDPSGDDVSATEVVTVLPATSIGWCTPEQALGFTGEAFTQAQLTLASSVITIYAGRTPDQPASSILATDRNWLAMATAFQAHWMPGKPGLLTHRESHKATSADGVNVTRSSDSDIVLAPLAARTLRNLSWIGNQSVFTGPDVLRPKGSFISEEADEYHTWTPRPLG